MIKLKGFRAGLACPDPNHIGKVKDKNNVNYYADKDTFGKPVLYFRGIPVQVCDAILNTEVPSTLYYNR